MYKAKKVQNFSFNRAENSCERQSSSCSCVRYFCRILVSLLLIQLSSLPGVLKAVGHINDTLGPALIASVSH